MRQLNAIIARSIIATLAVLLVSASAAAQVNVTGLIFGASGTVPAQADVHLYPITSGIGAEPILSQKATDGSFDIQIDDYGWYNLIVTAVGHDYVTIPLILTPSTGDLDLNITLPTLPYVPEPSGLSVIGSWNDFDFKSAELMTRQDDGSYAFQKVMDSDDDVLVQIIGLAETPDGGTRSVNLKNSDDYVYDGGGDYRSVIHLTGDTLRLSVDPDDYFALRRDDRLVQFSDDQHRFYWETAQLFDATEEEYGRLSRELASGEATIDPQALKELPDSLRWEVENAPLVMWRDYVDQMIDLIDNVTSEIPRQFAALNVMKMAARMRPKDLKHVVSESEMETIKTILNPNSQAWRYYPTLAPVAAQLGVDDPVAALKSLKKETPYDAVRQATLSHLVMMLSGKGMMEEARDFYAELEEETSDDSATPIAEYVLKEFNPDKRIQPGKPVPSFEVEILASADPSDIGTKVSDKSMRGQWYLIDFWATWCGPCVGEMPNLHDAFDEFSGRNFTILSLSFDGDFDKVRAFRKDRYAMPWMHAFVEGNFKSDLANTFEVQGIPKPVLVNPQGEIVAVGSQLRGEQLKETLAKYLIEG
jgi:thiol-disulfide isomerase/thioredoxin